MNTLKHMTDREFFAKYSRLVHKLAMSYLNRNYNLDHDDLVQEGMLGLVVARNRYKADLGTQFHTYAYHYVKGYMLDYIKRICTIERRESVGLPVVSGSPNSIIFSNRLNLTDKQEQFVKYRYNEGMTLRETGRELGVSKTAALGIEREIKRQLLENMI